MNDILSTKVLGNNLETYLIIFIILVSASLMHLILKLLQGKIFSKTGFLQSIAHQVLAPLIWLAAFYFSLRRLDLPGWLNDIVNVIYIIVATWLITRILIKVIVHITETLIHKTKSEEEQRKLLPLLSFTRLILWILGFLYLLKYLGVDITTALAGLGIGGIAVALAAQTILGDLFSYFVINFDKPFEIGDFLIFDDKLGSVEKIGIKSTKIRALSGEQIIVSNSNLINSRLHNFKRMQRRRIAFGFGVTYQTTSAQLQEIPNIVKSIIQEIERTEFDRSHFKNYGNFSLDFENVYYIDTNDYNIYMDIQQQINLKLYEKFEQMGISFAYPTQTLFINRQD